MNSPKSGLSPGDTIAISMTGSMPGANIAVLMACESMGLNYVTISSLGASSWGATDMDLSWPKMEKYFTIKNLLIMLVINLLMVVVQII